MNEEVTIRATLKHETTKAGLYLTEEGDVWIPKSVIVDGDDDTLVVPRWFAEERGLEYEEP
jgi:hypothetical protein